jgi:hypothetical protein
MEDYDDVFDCDLTENEAIKKVAQNEYERANDNISKVFCLNIFC